MKKNLFLLCVGSIAYAQTGNVGINTTTPTNTLHVKSASNPIRAEGLQASTSAMDQYLVTDANGVIKRLTSATKKSAEILGDSHDFTPLSVGLNVPDYTQYVEQKVATKTITLNRTALVITNYNLTYSMFRDSSKKPLTDGHARSVQALIKYSDTGANYYGYTTKEYTNYDSSGAQLYGNFGISSQNCRVLSPGTYTIDLYGAGASNKTTTDHFYIQWGTDTDDFQVNAIYLE